jgi:hypothetical protein
MTLAAGERRALAKIEKSLRGSDPKLVARLSTFNRLTQAEEMPQRESLPAPSRLRRLSAGAGFWSGRNRRTPPRQPGSSRRTGRPASGRDYRPGRNARLGRRSGSGSASGPDSTSGPGPGSTSGPGGILGPGGTPDSGSTLGPGGILGPGTPADPTGTPSNSHHFGTSRLPSQGRYPHTMRLSSSGRRPGRSRIAAILSVAMAACALGLMVILFSVLNHVRPAGATPAPATTCHYVMMAGCRSAQIAAHKR